MESLHILSEQFEIYFTQLAYKLPAVIIGVSVVWLLHFLLRGVRVKVVRYAQEKAKDKLLIDFANSLIRFVNMTIMFLLFMSIIGFGNVASTILGAAGISAFVIGFALKDIGENFLAGVIMAFDRPFRLGDAIQTLGVEGVITKMSLRDTHVKTFDGKDVFVPNGQIIKNPLYNYTMDGFIRHQFVIGVDYHTDIEKARSIILNAVRSVSGVLGDHKPSRTHVKLLNTSTIDIECHFWINTFDPNYSGTELKSLAQSSSIEALISAGISMPADIVELKNYDNDIRISSN